MDAKEICFQKRLDSMLTYVSQYRFNNQHKRGGGGGDLYDRLMSIRIFTLTSNQKFIQALKMYTESGYGFYLDLLIISC
jgi:hypothetical protein